MVAPIIALNDGLASAASLPTILLRGAQQSRCLWVIFAGPGVSFRTAERAGSGAAVLAVGLLKVKIFRGNTRPASCIGAEERARRLPFAFLCCHLLETFLAQSLSYRRKWDLQAAALCRKTTWVGQRSLKSF